MPVYQYECEDCSCRFELKQSFSDNSTTTCPQCEGEAKRIFSPVAIIFKGPGFYTTDVKQAKDKTKARDKTKAKDEASKPRSEQDSSKN